MLIAQRVWHVKALLTPALASSVLPVKIQMLSTLRGRPALHVPQAPGLTLIDQSVSAALGPRSPPSANARTVLYRTLLTPITRRVRVVHLGRSRM